MWDGVAKSAHIATRHLGSWRFAISRLVEVMRLVESKCARLRVCRGAARRGLSPASHLLLDRAQHLSLHEEVDGFEQ
jgi:hypothetical protein